MARIALLFLVALPVALACNGYKIVLKELFQGPNNVITLSDDFNVVLTDDCKVTFEGCMIVPENISVVVVNATIYKDGFRLFHLVTDICQNSELNPPTGAVKDILETLGFADGRCPMQQGQTCNNSFDISRLSLLLGLVSGEIDGTIIIDHGNNSSSDFTFQVELTR